MSVRGIKECGRLTGVDAIAKLAGLLVVQCQAKVGFTCRPDINA
jgi:hypothetical protein